MRTLESKRAGGCLVTVREESAPVPDRSRYIALINECADVTTVRSRREALAMADALRALAIYLPDDTHHTVFN